MPKSVLVVDDDVDMRDTLVDVLNDAGYATSTASNGHEAISRLRSEPDTGVILLDLMMPICDGAQFRRIQLEDPGMAKTPVVLFSADTQISAVANDLKADGFVPKPVDLRVLMSLVKKFCG